MSDEQWEKCADLIQDLGLSFWCEDCGTELCISDGECDYCGEPTHWSTDCQVAEVMDKLNGFGYFEDERYQDEN